MIDIVDSMQRSVLTVYMRPISSCALVRQNRTTDSQHPHSNSQDFVLRKVLRSVTRAKVEWRTALLDCNRNEIDARTSKQKINEDAALIGQRSIHRQPLIGVHNDEDSS